MTIGIDIRSLSGGAYTGVGEYTRNILRYISDIDKVTKFKLFFNAHNSKPDLSFLDGKSNVELYFFNYPNKYFSARTRFLNTPKIDRMIGGCDVFFSPHFISTPVTSQCRKVITFHDLSFERYPEFFDGIRKFWHFSNNPKKQAKAAQSLIAVSESTAYDLFDIYGVDPKKISIVYSGINEKFSKNKTQEETRRVKRKYNLPERFILSLSTIEPRKNVLGTIKAFEVFKKSVRSIENPEYNIKLIIAGKPGWLYKETFSAIKNSKYKKDIAYIGFIDDADKPALYKLADLFVYPSIYEGFGFPPLEAMASGTPVITSACSSLPEVAEDAALLVDPFKISDIAWMMKEVIIDKELANSLRAKGLAQAKKFSWQKCAEETLGVLLSRK
jgi:glycosyltransferase involved in cell wall biosynthesis